MSQTINGTLTYGANTSSAIELTNTALKRSLPGDFEAKKRDVEQKLALSRKVHQQRRSTLPESRDLAIHQPEARQIGNYVPQIPLVDVPAYPIRNGGNIGEGGNFRLSRSTVSPNATNYDGLQAYSVHK